MIKDKKKENFSQKKCWKKQQIHEELLNEIEALGIQTQVEALHQRGFDRIKKIVKALVRNDLDLEKAAAFLGAKRARWDFKAKELPESQKDTMKVNDIQQTSFKRKEFWSQ